MESPFDNIAQLQFTNVYRTKFNMKSTFLEVLRKLKLF